MWWDPSPDPRLAGTRSAPGRPLHFCSFAVMARGKHRNNRGGSLNKGGSLSGRENRKRSLAETLDHTSNNVSTSQPLATGASNDGSTSIPTVSSNNGSTSMPMGAGDNGTTEQVIVDGDVNNGSTSEPRNVGNINELPTACEHVIDASAQPNSDGSIEFDETDQPNPSIYDAINVTRTVNGRIAIAVVANKIWPSPARAIRKIFELQVDVNGYAWKTISAETKNYYFEEFRKRCYWDDGMEALVRSAWEAKAAKVYSGMISEANTNKKRLNFVPQNIWDQWQVYFNSPEFLLISKRNSDNRKKANNGAGVSRHVGGSIPHAEHAKRLRKKLGRPPTFHELFKLLHTKKRDGVTFVDDKASDINEKVTNLLEQRMENQEVIDENQIFVEAATGNRSDRIYGIGSVGDLYRANGGSTSAATTSSSSAPYTSAAVQQQVEQLVQQQVKQIVDQQVESRVRELIHQMFPNHDMPQFPRSSD